MVLSLRLNTERKQEMTDNYNISKDYALEDMKATNDRLHNFIANLNMKPSSRNYAKGIREAVCVKP